ncbi:MAG: HAD family phosphatase [Atopobiaceae bacterium]|nr:HAD family phosphatase [Atopobiaceae bacterium]
MTKLFASDFDGTLHFWGTDDRYLVNPTDTQAILDFQAQGGLFGVCTGRPLFGLTRQTDAAPGLDFTFDFYIATTGAAIWDRDRQLIWSKTISRELAHDLYRTLSPMAVVHEQALVCAAEDYWSFTDSTEWPLCITSSFDDIEGPFYGYAMETETIEIAQEAAALVNERYAGLVTAYVNLASIDVVPAGCSKGTGLRRAAEYYGAGLTAGMGDSFNDLPLLDAADVAYTFNSSPAEMHAHADVLIDTAAEGILNFMQR